MSAPLLIQLLPQPPPPSIRRHTPSSPPSHKNHHHLKSLKRRHDKNHDHLKPRKRCHDDDASAVAAWTSSIARRSCTGLLSAAAAEFADMLAAGVAANRVTLLTLLSSISDLSPSPAALPLAAALHALAAKLGAAADVALATALLDAYAKCARPDLARQVFDRMPHRNSLTHNAMIAGYMRNRDVGNAASIFRQAPRRDRVSWTAMIDGFIKNGLLDQALVHFRGMQAERVAPDYVTLIAVIAACAELGTLGLGLWVHRYLTRQDFRNNLRVGNSLVDMYSRCGRVDFARQQFNNMPARTRVTWNSMIAGFAANGCSREALEHFSLMTTAAGLEPDGFTFTGALTACSHAGLVEEGLGYYDAMRRVCKIRPRVEHYGCVVDLLGRAGRLDDAMRVMESMPMRPNEVVLGSLLASCRVHGDVEMAERVMSYVVQLEPDGESNYVLMSNVYAAIGRWDGVGEVRNRMKAMGIRKRPGYSAVEIDCELHEFMARDRSHPRSGDVYDMLDLIDLELKQHGYDPIVSPDYD